MSNNDEKVFEVIKDYGSFGEGKWEKHLTKISWYGNEAKYDLRPWNPDMTKPGRGITFDDGELFDLMGIIENALGSED